MTITASDQATMRAQIDGLLREKSQPSPAGANTRPEGTSGELIDKFPHLRGYLTSPDKRVFIMELAGGNEALALEITQSFGLALALCTDYPLVGAFLMSGTKDAAEALHASWGPEMQQEFKRQNEALRLIYGTPGGSA